MSAMPIDAANLQDVTVAYREGPALSGISLDIHEGEMLGISGPNGAGKTTLLRLLQGLIPPTSGRVTILGDEMNRRSARRLRQLIACVPQVFEVDRRVPVTAADVVLMGRYGIVGLLKQPGAQDREIADAAIALVSGSRLASRPFGRLSGGERQRIMIARAIAQRPRILLLDEPTTYLDADSREQFLDLVRRVHAEERLTTVIVSHDSSMLAGLCDRVALMRDGKIAGFQGRTPEVQS
jgi:ABC-type cobalamin/Fe3+-siderophores transport system ATPase subunit